MKSSPFYNKFTAVVSFLLTLFLSVKIFFAIASGELKGRRGQNINFDLEPLIFIFTLLINIFFLVCVVLYLYLFIKNYRKKE